MHPLRDYFQHCLYFSAGTLFRHISHMAEEEFAQLGLSPSHAFLLMLVLERPGSTQKEYAGALRLAPSTVTRLVEALERKGLVERRSQSRTSQVFPLAKGKGLAEPMEAAWERLFERYKTVLGDDACSDLTERIHAANELLEG